MYICFDKLFELHTSTLFLKKFQNHYLKYYTKTKNRQCISFEVHFTFLLGNYK